VSYVEFLMVKALVLIAIAFVWGLICGLIGQPLDPREWSDR
jgi:hypothetical protein